MSSSKYAKLPKVQNPNRKWPSASIEKAPIWCAVDLRDGNQALPNPMTPGQKKKYFQLLVDIGFKEIEVGFPSASVDDFEFCRKLIEGNLVPEDVTISVLTQAREHLISKTLDSLEGVKKAVVHFYIATSDLHTKFVFGLTQAELLESAINATRQIRNRVETMTGSEIGLEFSPEEFTDSDLNFVVELCDAVVEEWNPGERKPVILNLPQTVERRLPNEYADLIEVFRGRQKHPNKTIISVHNHNDMGSAVAATLQCLLAGAQRVEGTLFGHGERTGNVDLVTVALDLEYLGMDTGLKFDKLLEVAKTVEKITSIGVHPRHPYAGELVFSAFSGSHQDAIRKGLSKKEELSQYFGGWKIPYLHIDPSTIGRVYERFIRINSQSGKGGIAHILETDYHIKLPRWVQVDLAIHIQSYADKTAKEISSQKVWEIFQEVYVKHDHPITLINYWPRPSDNDPAIIEGEVHLLIDNKEMTLQSNGNGPISAFVRALRKVKSLPKFILEDYAEETMGISADAEAICFIKILFQDIKQSRIGIGIGNNIDQAAVRAVLAGVNAFLAQEVGF